MKKTIALFVLFLAAFQVTAQETTTERKGFIIGVSAGLGISSITGDTPGISDGIDISLPNLKVGLMINPKLAVLVTNPGISYSRDGLDRSLDGFVPSVQYWAKPKWWISGGFGLAMDNPAFYDSKKTINDDYNFGTACQFSTGYELYKKGRFVIDLQGTLFAASVNTDWGTQETVSFLTGVGFNFY